MIKPQLSVSQWVILPQPIRIELIKVFEIPKSEGTKMEQGPSGARMVSDGHTHSDLSVITIEKMQRYLNSNETDFFVLFNNVIEKIKLHEESTVEEKIKRQEFEVIAKWTMILQEIKEKADEYNLTNEFQALIKKLFIYEEPISTRQTNKQRRATGAKKDTTASKREVLSSVTKGVQVSQ